MSEWSEVSLGTVAEIVMGQSPPGSTYNENGEGLPFFQGVKDFGYRYPTPRVFCSQPSRIAKPGDLLFSVRAPIGRVNIADRECAIGRGLAIIRPRKKGDVRYIEFVLRYLEPTWHTIEGSGSVFGNATRRDLEQLLLPWPEETSERRAIAHILGTLDDKIELNRRMNETLEQMARAIFKAWFVDFEPVRAKMEGRWKRGQSLPGMLAHFYDLFPDRLVDSELGKIPEGWEVGKIRDCCERVENGGTPKRGEARFWEPAEVPWLTSGEVRQAIVTKTKNMISEEGLSNSSAKLWPAMTTVVALYGATAGQVCLLGETMCANQACCGLIPKKDTRYFVYMYMSMSAAFLAQQARGSAQQNLSQQIVADLPVVIPRPKVWEIYDKLVHPLFSRWIVNIENSFTLADLRDTLLPKLISREIRVKDAEGFLKERGL